MSPTVCALARSSRPISARGSRLLLRASPSTITVVCGVIAFIGLSPTRPVPQMEGAPRFVRTKAFAAVAVIFTVVNLACYALAYWLSPR